VGWLGRGRFGGVWGRRQPTVGEDRAHDPDVVHGAMRRRRRLLPGRRPRGRGPCRGGIPRALAGRGEPAGLPPGDAPSGDRHGGGLPGCGSRASQHRAPRRPLRLGRAPGLRRAGAPGLRSPPGPLTPARRVRGAGRGARSRRRKPRHRAPSARRRQGPRPPPLRPPRGALALGLSLTRKLADSHLVSGKAAAAEEIGLSVDQVLLTDTNGTGAFRHFEAMGVPRLRPPLAVTCIDRNVYRAPASDRPGPAPPQPDHTAATSVTLARAARRASQRSPRSTETAARAAVCPAHAARDAAPVAGAGSPESPREPDQSRAVSGAWPRRPRGSRGGPGCRCTGRVAGTGVNVSCALGHLPGPARSRRPRGRRAARLPRGHRRRGLAARSATHVAPEPVTRA